MIDADSYSGICDYITSSFYEVRQNSDHENYRESPTRKIKNAFFDILGINYSIKKPLQLDKIPQVDKVKMVGVLFCRPDLPIAESQIIGSLNYYHFRSGEHIDFFCAGYGTGWPLDKYRDQRKVTSIDGEGWYFSDNCFNGLRKDLANRTKWDYSGQVDLILTDAKLDSGIGKAALDFSEAIVCRLTPMDTSKAIEDIPTFFEQIFKYAENPYTKRPTFAFSDLMGLKHAGKALETLIPKSLRDSWKGIKKYHQLCSTRYQQIKTYEKIACGRRG